MHNAFVLNQLASRIGNNKAQYTVAHHAENIISLCR